VKCANACTDKSSCVNVAKWFDCNHTQCVRTTVILNYCIWCGNDVRVKQYDKRCRMCRGKYTLDDDNLCQTCKDQLVEYYESLDNCETSDDK
jgi:hypothetical protein